MDARAFRDAFSRMDLDGDGVITASELTACLGDHFGVEVETREAVEAIMADFDANGDGILELDEICAAWRRGAR